MGDDRPLVVFLGHHKCGTSWTQDILKAVSRELRLRYVTASDPPRSFGYDLQRFAEEKRADVLYYANPDYECVEQLEDFRGFHIIRDPRDVCVSAYFSHLHSHTPGYWTEGRREQLQFLPKDAGLLLEMDFLERVMSQMYSWKYTHPNVLELRLEDLAQAPYRWFLEVFKFLGILDEQPFTLRRRLKFLLGRSLRRMELLVDDRLSFPLALKQLPAEVLLGIFWENSFQKKSGGRKRGEEDPKSHYRKGVAGDWRNHFKQQHIDEFKRRYNPLLLKLGYEQSPDWK